MPFFPMRPTLGRRLVQPVSIRQLWYEAVEQKHWIMQPKLNGDRAELACVGGKVYVQNRYGSCYAFKVANAKDFLKLPQPLCLDGEVWKGNFYPFEVMACNGVNFLRAEAHERVQWAKDMVQWLGHAWLFETPSLAWLLRRSANLPTFEGVVLKQFRTPYVLLGSASQSSLLWMKRRWS
jgi:ATP-dependent DNA ligase